jgi:hypothetical protein
MNRGTASFFLAVAASAALVAGCGGGSSNTSSSTSSHTTTITSSAKTTAAQTSSSTSHSSSTTAAIPAGGAAIAAYCQNALAAAKTKLTASEKSQFTAYCASLANDSPAQIKAAEKKLCSEIVIDTVPAADRALASSVCAKL